MTTTLDLVDVEPMWSEEIYTVGPLAHMRRPKETCRAHRSDKQAHFKHTHRHRIDRFEYTCFGFLLQTNQHHRVFWAPNDKWCVWGMDRSTLRLAQSSSYAIRSVAANSHSTHIILLHIWSISFVVELVNALIVCVHLLQFGDQPRQRRKRNRHRISVDRKQKAEAEKSENCQT